MGADWKSVRSGNGVRFEFCAHRMIDDVEEIDTLRVYLESSIKHKNLIEAVWLAFKYKEKHPEWNVSKCFEKSLWDNLLSDAKREPKYDLNSTIRKLKELETIYKKQSE